MLSQAQLVRNDPFGYRWYKALAKHIEPFFKKTLKWKDISSQTISVSNKASLAYINVSESEREVIRFPCSLKDFNDLGSSAPTGTRSQIFGASEDWVSVPNHNMWLALIYLFIYLFIHSFIHSFIYLFIYLFIYWFIYLSFYLFIYSLKIGTL